MAYHIIYSNYSFIQYIILDFIDEKVLEVINCKTKEGKRRYKELFGNNKRKSNKNNSTNKKTEYKVLKDFIINKSDVEFVVDQLNERGRRLFAGFIAKGIKKNGIECTAKLTGISEKTICKGIKEINERTKLPNNQVRKEGGGRITKEVEYKEFSSEIDNIIEDDLAGDPMTEKKWIRKTLRYIKKRLETKNIKASINTIKKNLKKKDISLKVNTKSASKKSHPDRDLQFQIINEKKRVASENNVPVISLDGKKKEMIGNFKNQGKTYRKDAYDTLDHDFLSYAEGKLIPFGFYDIYKNFGYVCCGTSYETSEFAVDSLVMWWENYGQKTYPFAKEILILCDGGGANGSRVKGWKYYLQVKFVDVFGITVHISHFPPYTSKWNPIEHRLFSFISLNWAGEPLTSYEKALGFINSTKTEKGLQVKGELLNKEYKLRQKITDDQMESLNIIREQNFPKWNYSLFPKSKFN